MDSLRWQRVEALFAEALERPAPARASFVRSASGDDRDLEAEVLSLLESAERDPEFLVTPLVDPGQPASWPSAPDRSARRVGRYRLVRLLGRGGMGEVHLAVQEGEGFEKPVALKLIRGGFVTDEAARRFRRERRILARLRHPHIATLLDGGSTDDGVPFVVMEFIDGERIDRWCDVRAVDVEGRVRLLLDACAAVQHAHRSLVIHRDLKPANILVTGDGRVKLLDFGIGKLLDAEVESDDDPVRGIGELVTRTGRHLLTPEYAAPEQLRGEPASTATDVFALGVVAYELLVGVHPWAGMPPEARLAAIAAGPPSRPSAAVTKESNGGAGTLDPTRRRRSLAGDLDTILLKAVRAEPERRYPTVDALADDLRRHLDGRPVSARLDTFGYRASRFVRRNRPAVVAAGAVAVTLLGALSAVAGQRGRAAARVEAERDKLLRTRDFLLEMFGAVGPDEGDGGEVSARALLDAQTQSLGGFADRPELQAEMQYVLADGYQRLGLVDEAQALAEAALATREATLEAGDPDLARARGLLGWIERERGETRTAERHLRSAVAEWRTQADREPGGLARALNDLGVVLGDQTRYEEAVAMLEEAADLRRPGSPGGGAQAFGVTANNLATAYFQLGRTEEAVARMEEAVAALEASLGPTHARVWLARANLMSLRTVGVDAEEQIRAWRDHLAGAERLFGPTHRETARALQYLGSALVLNLPGPEGREVRLTEAGAIFDRALQVAEATFGPEHPRVAYILGGVAHVRFLQGDYRAAVAARGRQVAILRGVYGDSHRDLGTPLRELARGYYAMGDAEAGDRIALEALEHHRLAYGPGDPTTLSQQVNVARRMTERGDAVEAVALLREAADGLASVESTSPTLLAQTRIALARALARTGRPAEGSRVLEDVRPGIDSLPESVRRMFGAVSSEVGSARSGGG